MKKPILSTFLALATSAVSFAQVQGDRPEPNLDAVIAHVQLTDSQIACLETNQDAAREAAAPLFEQLRELSRSLREAARAGEDVTAIESEIGAVRGSLAGVKSTHVASAQSCLDSSQAEALGEIIAAATLRQEVRQAASLLLINVEQGFGRDGGPARRRGPGPRR